MPKSPKPPPADASNEDENKRPTVVPPFDVEALARSGAVEPSGCPPMRAQSVTLVDEAELEAARLASMHRSSLPPVLASTPPRERPGEDPVIEILSNPPLDADPLEEARLRLDAGDETGALAIVEDLLRRTPSHAPARELAAECERVLVEKYTTALGRLDRVPKLAVALDRLVSLALDHRAGFLISFIDGQSTVAAIVDMSGMPPRSPRASTSHATRRRPASMLSSRTGSHRRSRSCADPRDARRWEEEKLSRSSTSPQAFGCGTCRYFGRAH